MLRSFIFKAAYYLKYPGAIRYYHSFQDTQWLPFEQLKESQEQQLAKIINFAYWNVPHYSKLFNSLDLTPLDVTTLEDLQKLPILTKQIIKDNWRDFIPNDINRHKYRSALTSGSTAKPFQYRLSRDDHARAIGLLFRGYEYAGYRLADKIVRINPSSSRHRRQPIVRKVLRDSILNSRSFSSFTASPQYHRSVFNFINAWKPGFIKGYASSIYIFARFMQDNNLKLEYQPKAIFNNGEMIMRKQRKIIEEAFGSQLFDQYGLNDGGVSAYECEEHCGMHVDIERAVLEIVDETGKQIVNQEGSILATSLYNYALPFIRYDTGDAGIMSDSKCPCGRGTPLLKTVSGRTHDTLIFGDMTISNPRCTGIMTKFDIEQYQLIQEGPSSLTIRIVKGKTYNPDDEKLIKKRMIDLFRLEAGTFNVNMKFDYVDSISAPKSGKYKYAINNTSNF
jgi:phenylacetate-CoA ligase